MNQYKILTFSFGKAGQHIVEAYDIFQALNNSAINHADIIKITLIGTTEP